MANLNRSGLEPLDLNPINTYEQKPTRWPDGQVRMANVIPGSKAQIPIDTGEQAVMVLSLAEGAPTLLRGGKYLITEGPALIKNAPSAFGEALSSVKSSFGREVAGVGGK